MKICKICNDKQLLEILVQMDQKIYVDCLCTGNTIQKIAQKAFQAGYKHCKNYDTVTKNVQTPHFVG